MSTPPLRALDPEVVAAAHWQMAMAFFAHGPDHELGQAWLGSTLELARRSRKLAGLTQRQVAQRMNLSQSNVAAIEASRGAITLKSFVRYVLACGYMPLPVALVPLARWRTFSHDLMVRAQGAEAEMPSALAELEADELAASGPSGVNLLLAAAGGPIEGAVAAPPLPPGPIGLSHDAYYPMIKKRGRPRKTPFPVPGDLLPGASPLEG